MSAARSLLLQQTIFLEEVGPSFPASEFHDVLLLSSQAWTPNSFV